MSPNPLVSVVIPYYNQQNFIAQTVWSAKGQTYPNVEIIVVDDGSPAPAEPHLREINGIRLLRTDNHGCPATRNRGFLDSSGEYLIFLDGDDLLLPRAIEDHLAALAQQPEAGVSFGGFRVIDEHGKQIQPAHACRPRKDYFLMLLESNPLPSPGAAMIRRDAFLAAGPFDECLRTGIDDYDLYLRLARHCSIVQHASCVLDYRRHHSNVSNDSGPMLEGLLALLDRMEKSETLTPSERRRLRFGRRRWIHAFRPQKTIAYRLLNLFYLIRAVPNVPIRALFRVH